MKTRWLIYLLSCCFFTTFSVQAWAQESYPSKPITFILSNTPGGATDMSTKGVLEGMKKVLNTPIIPKYVPGVGGTLGATEVSKSRPDGYTIGNANLTALAFTPLHTKVKFDPLTDFSFIGTYARVTQGLIVNATSPFKTLPDFVKAAKEKPGEIKFGNTLPGSWNGLIPTYLEKVEKIRFKVVPFPGGEPQAISALLGNHIDFMCSSTTFIKPYVASGRVRLLGAAYSKRIVDLTVPTFKEMGYDFEMSTWVAAAAPKGVTSDVKNKLGAALARAVKEPDYIKLMNSLDTEINYLNDEEYRKVVVSYTKIWGELLKDGYRY